MIKILKAAFINWKNEREYRLAVKETIRELSRLTNHELWDIGLARGDIWSVAHDSHTRPKKVEVEDIQINANIKGWV